MLKSKAIDIIKTFSPEELKRFVSFVSSPYFNSVKSLIRLTEVLRNHYPDFSTEDLTEVSLYEKVYGKGKFSYSVMKNLMSDLIPLCEKFLIHDRLRNDNIKNEGNSIELLQELRERRLNNQFNSRSKKFDKLLSEHRFDNIVHFIKSNQHEVLKYQYHLHNHRYNNLIWKGFLKRSDFDMCSIFQTLYMTSGMIIHSAELLKGNEEESLMVKFVKELDFDSILKKFDPDDSEEYFFINLYSKLILLTLEEDKDQSEDYFYDIKSSLIKNINLFSQVDVYDILKSLRSYCISRMRIMKSIFIDELYEIDKLLVEKVSYNSVYIKWYIGELFTEIVQLSIYSKKYDYAESFIEKFKSRLSADVVEFETGFTKAFLYLEYGETDKALELLSRIKPINNSMKLHIKNLYLRAYYEKGYFEEGFSILDAFIHFINKEENMSEVRRKLYNLKYNVNLKLFKMRVSPEKYSGHDVNNLRKELDKFYFLADKDWYLSKLKELETLIEKK
ncbi:MAG: hypothetical protein WAT71_03130 [Ignavibacteria bacterium]